MFKVIITERALKDLEIQRRLILKLKEYSKSPYKYSKKLINSKIGTYRFRIGKYRIIFDIKDQNIVVLRIGDRNNIYK